MSPSQTATKFNKNEQDNKHSELKNFTVPYTRIYEHKHFEFGKQTNTVISREYPVRPGRDVEPFYPIQDINNMAILNKYKNLAKGEENVIFGGRLAEYKYYDMHQVIASALQKAKKELHTASISTHFLKH